MKSSFNYKYIAFIVLISALGGLLFGYDWVVIGGAKRFYEIFFGIRDMPALQGWVMSSALVGCLVGAISSGTISDKLGRKKPLIFAAALFTLSAIGTGASNNLTFFIIYRIIGGLGIGMASVLSPIYIAEVSPAKMRGRFVAINQLTIVIGILLAQIINLNIAQDVPADFSDTQILVSWNGQNAWRWMFWAQTLFAGLFFLLAFFIPESPRWLVKAKFNKKATTILEKIGGKSYGVESFHSIKETLKNETAKVDFKDLKSPKIKRVVFIGIVLAILQQWCGINVIFNYADEIFTQAGYGINDMLFNIVATGGVNLLFTFAGMALIDRWGRRKLMMLGFGGLSILYLVFGLFYHMELKGFIMLASVLTGIAIYAMTLAPATWVVLSEIFPNKVRGIAMSIATLALWSGCFILTYLFPVLNKLAGASGTFWLFGVICIGGFYFIRKYLPETKGKTLEEIESEF
jgi:SP family arabinose:H+ symporter-like MFS transporter